jgi:hypothetical protein
MAASKTALMKAMFNVTAIIAGGLSVIEVESSIWAHATGGLDIVHPF